MKKLIVFLMVLLLLGCMVFATNQKGIHEAGTGISNSEIKTSGQGTSQDNQGKQVESVLKKAKAGNVTELKQMIHVREQIMNQEMKSFKEKEQNVFRNQNRVRLAVHSLLAMEDLTGGIGQQVSTIAKEFNNSVKSTIDAEEKIQKRGWFVRLFSGGDIESASKLDKEVKQNQQRVQKLEQLHKQCNCTSEVRAMLKEQIQNLQQEQNRLGDLVKKEKKSKGMFGWIWR